LLRHSPSKVNKRFLDRSVWIWNQSLFEHLRMKIVFINMAAYSNIEWADIHYMYGRANGNCRKAQRFYQQIFPQRRCPSKNTFSSVHRRLRETGSFLPNTVNRGRNRNIRTPAIEEQVIRRVTENPRLSTRQIALEMQNVSSSTVWKILNEDLLYPYHIQRVQALLPADYPSRVIFAQWYLQQCTFPNFEVSILFTDEANFSHDAIINHHNNHLWSYENPHDIIESRHQHKFSCNVWAGIIGDFLLGPIFLPPTLNGNNYTQFLETQLPILLEDVPLQIRNQMWFMQDGAPAHFSRIAREFLNNNYTNRWIGRRGPIAWPARSPDLNPLDFYLWGHLKTIVYDTPVATVEVLRNRIIAACEKIRNTPGIFERLRQSMRRRCEACIDAEGNHFQQFL